MGFNPMKLATQDSAGLRGATLMPLYQYQCTKCPDIVEVPQSIENRDQFPTCVKCTSPMRRVLIAPQIKFQGPGFYSTDK